MNRDRLCGQMIRVVPSKDPCPCFVWNVNLKLLLLLSHDTDIVKLVYTETLSELTVILCLLQELKYSSTLSFLSIWGECFVVIDRSPRGDAIHAHCRRACL